MVAQKKQVVRAAEHLMATLREFDDGEYEPVATTPLWQTIDAFEAPHDGKLRFRDLPIGEDFHFMGS